MNNALVFLCLIIVGCNSLLSQTYKLPQKHILLMSETVPHASSVKVKYSAVYQDIENKEYVFCYDWSDDFREVEYETIWQQVKATFDDRGHLTSIVAKSKDYPYPVQQDDKYEYDEQERVICKFNDRSKSEAFYTGTDTDSIVSWDLDESANVWNKTTKQEVKYSDEYYDILHYSFDNEKHEYKYLFTTRYELDSEGRVIRLSDIDSSGGSVYEYDYVENGYSLLISYSHSEHPIFKYDVVFNDNGDLQYEIYSEWMNGSYWKQCNQIYNDYKYLNSSVDGNICNDKIFTILGNALNFNTNSWIEVSTIFGMDIYCGIGTEKCVTIPLNTVCVIKAGRKAYKILVR